MAAVWWAVLAVVGLFAVAGIVLLCLLLYPYRRLSPVGGIESVAAGVRSRFEALEKSAEQAESGANRLELDEAWTEREVAGVLWLAFADTHGRLTDPRVRLRPQSVEATAGFHFGPLKIPLYAATIVPTSLAPPEQAVSVVKLRVGLLAVPRLIVTRINASLGEAIAGARPDVSDLRLSVHEGSIAAHAILKRRPE
jgi:hypothetical protein